MTIHPNSLAATLDSVNEALLFENGLSQAEKQNLARWIAGRQWDAGFYAGLFAPTEEDYRAGARLFTGEKLRTKLAVRSVLSAEAARTLLRFDLSMAEAQEALRRVRRTLQQACFAADHCVVGECAHAGIAFMRYLAAGGGDDAVPWLEAHLGLLSQHRDGQGRWRRFPFYYTLLVLSEIDLPAAVEELRYAAPAAERHLQRSAKDGPFARRRQVIVQRALDRCGQGR